MTALAQALLFLSSYSPLLFVFALLDTFGRGLPAILCAAAGVLGAILLPTVMSVARRAAAYPLAIATASPRDSDVLAYVASYLVPFASVNADTGKERIALGIFVALVAVLYVRSELFYINPLLAAVGYRVFAVETPGGTPVVLLCRRRFIRPDSEVRAVRISDYVWMEKKGDG